MADSITILHQGDDDTNFHRFREFPLTGSENDVSFHTPHELSGSMTEVDSRYPKSCHALPIATLSEFPEKSRSVGSSPVKMESCLFSFPIPTPKTWTIMVEPITNQTSTSQLQHWKAQQGSRRVGVQSLDRNSSPPEAGLSPHPKETRLGITASPRRTKRNRIYLNGTCIDKGVGAKSDDQPGRQSRGRREEHGRTFTFINDKRMASPKDVSSRSAVSLIPFSPPLSPFSSASPIPSIASSAKARPLDSEKPRRGRRSHKKFLTFHQLEFDNETLKPYDRSVFVSGHSARPARRLSSVPKITVGDGQGKVGNRQSLLEAAEMLLELQMHPSSETNSSLEVPLSLSSTSPT